MLPTAAAYHSADRPTASVTFAAAPRSSSSLTSSASAIRAACMSGVLRERSAVAAETPAASKARVIATSPRCTATDNNCGPSDASTRTPAEFSVASSAVSPARTTRSIALTPSGDFRRGLAPSSSSTRNASRDCDSTATCSGEAPWGVRTSRSAPAATAPPDLRGVIARHRDRERRPPLIQNAGLACIDARGLASRRHHVRRAPARGPQGLERRRCIALQGEIECGPAAQIGVVDGRSRVVQYGDLFGTVRRGGAKQRRAARLVGGIHARARAEQQPRHRRARMLCRQHERCHAKVVRQVDVRARAQQQLRGVGRESRRRLEQQRAPE